MESESIHTLMKTEVQVNNTKQVMCNTTGGPMTNYTGHKGLKDDWKSGIYMFLQC